MIVTFCAYDGRGQVNGPNIWLRRLLPQLRARGIDARVLLLLTAPPTECATLRALEAAGVPCRATPWPDSTWARVRWLLGELRATRPAVFVPNVMVPAYYAARWARAAGIATVGVLHSDDAFHHALVERFVAGAPRDRLNALVCVSRELETLARAAGGEVGTQITRIAYGVPVPNTMASAPTSELRLLYVGRLVEAQKRASDVARALCQAACELPGVTA
ncbi:MAG: glycosyltransferase, partial [Roseiflexaceae bacterium]|nr:glycosyltransferase [Roseiflexaceae bacterium]